MDSKSDFIKKVFSAFSEKKTPELKNPLVMKFPQLLFEFNEKSI